MTEEELRLIENRIAVRVLAAVTTLKQLSEDSNNPTEKTIFLAATIALNTLGMSLVKEDGS